MEPIKNINLDGGLNPTKFSNLDKEKQTSILEQKSVIFQGSETNLKELLSPLTKFDLDEIIDLEVLLKISRNEKILVGRSIAPLDEQDQVTYIPQLIRKTRFADRTTTTIEKLSQLDRVNHEDLITIGGITGTGKSTFLTHLANAIKRKMPNLWVLKVDLSRYSKSFQKFKDNDLKPVTLLDLLNSLPESRLRSDFEKKIFSIPDKVIILLDAVDEVLPEHKDMVVDIMRDCQSRSQNDVFVTYTLNLLVLATSMNLEKETDCQLTHTIEPFSQTAQETFLKKYWGQKFKITDEGKKKCEVFAKAVVQQNWFNEGPIGIPLLIRLLAEIFETNENFEGDTSEWEGFSNFLASTSSEPVLPKTITLTELFQLYIYKNCSGNAKANLNSLRDIIAKINSDSDSCLQVLALETIFDVSVCKHFNCYKTRTAEVPQKKLLQFNILKQIDNTLQFTHKTFADYFVAECISSELKNHQNGPFFKFLFEKILTSDRYKVTRAFLDSFLLTDLNSLQKEALTVMGNTVKVSDYNFLLYTSASEGLLELFKLLFKCCHVADINIDTKNLRVGNNHALHQAAQGGHFEVVKYLIENGGPIDVRNNKDCTVLHLAAKSGSLPMVKFLVERGVQVDCKDAEGRTALLEATKNRSFDMVRYLLEQGAYVNSRDKWGYTPLHIAAWMGDLDRVKYLVKNGAEIHYRGDRSSTVLSYAVLSRNLDVVKYLVEKGADVSMRTKSGGSMLHVLPEWNENICTENVIEVWKFLLEKGVDINTVDDMGDTVLHRAIKRGYKLDYVKFLVEHGADVNVTSVHNKSPLTEAISVNDVEIVRCLMDNGADFNVNNQNEDLCEAIKEHGLEVVKFLAERGIPLDFKHKDDYPALDIAICNGDLDMIKLLVRNKVKVDGPDVLLMALKTCNFDIVKFLVDSGAKTSRDFGEIESKDLEAVRLLIEKGATFRKFNDVGDNLELLEFLFENGIEVDKTNIFTKAAENGNLGIVKFLLEKGVDVNARNEERKAALHLAAKRNHISVIKCLLDGGADIEIKNRRGHTPLYVATSHGCLEAVKVLIEGGADVQNVTVGDETALIGAIKGRYVETIKYVVEQGATINVKTKYTETPMSVALKCQLLEGAELLAKRDSRYECTLKETVEIVQRNVNIEDAEAEEDDELLKAVFLSVKTVKYLIEKGVDFNPRVIDKFQFLFSAVSWVQGDFKLVKYLIEKGCDINIKDYYGYTALHKTTDLNIVELLIQNGGNVNAKNRQGESVLHDAIAKSNLDVCKLLVEHGADINAENESGQTLLHMQGYEWGSISIDKIKYLIEKGAKPGVTNSGRSVLQDAVATSHIDLDLVKYLLKLGQDVNCRDKNGVTPLDDAVDQGDLDVVRLLVENGAEIDKDTAIKTGVLFNAIKHHCRTGWDHSLDMVKYLVSKGANVNAKNEDGNTLLHEIVSRKKNELVKFLVESGADVNATDDNGSSLLHEASKNNDFSLVKHLIDKGALVDTETATGRTVLHEAASSGSYAAVKFFLENGANVNASDKERHTPLYDVAASRQTHCSASEALNVAKLLIEKGAEVNVKTRKGRTPLHEAASLAKINEVELLIENGADVSVKDEYGRTPLFALVMANKNSRWMILGSEEKEVVRFLVNSGANINERADNGRTVLHEAAIIGNLEMVKILIDLGAEINSRSLNDCTPLHDAAREGMLEVVEFLIQKGADVQAKNKRGGTALDEASKRKHDKVVDFLAKRMDKGGTEDEK